MEQVLLKNLVNRLQSFLKNPIILFILDDVLQRHLLSWTLQQLKIPADIHVET